MSDFGDEVGAQILQGIRGGRYVSRTLQFMYRHYHKNKTAQQEAQKVQESQKVVQIDFDTPSEAQQFAEYCKQHDVIAEATQASVVMYASDIDKLPIADELKKKIKASEKEKKKDKSEIKGKNKKIGTKAKNKGGGATERQMEFVSALHKKGVLSDSEIAALGDNPSRFAVNALLNRHQKEAGFINMTGSKSHQNEQSFLRREGSKCSKASKQLHEYKRDAVKAKHSRRKKVIHRKVPTR